MSHDAFDKARLIAQSNAAHRELYQLQQRVDALTRERDLLLARNARLSQRLMIHAKHLVEIRKLAARARPRVFDAFASLVLDDIAARDLQL